MKVWAVCLTVLLVGCVPWPHRANLTPGVAGALTVEGEPQAGALLRVVALDPEGSGSSCEGKSHEFKTTSEGTFYGPPVRTFRFFMVVMGHTFFPWAVCVKQNDAWAPLYQDKTYTLVDTGPWFLVEMSCHDMTCMAKENLEPNAELIESLEKRNE